MRSLTLLLFMVAVTLAARFAWSTEITLKNDSLTNNSSGVVEAGFVPGEKAATWLTSPCTGNIVAAQILWLSGGSAAVVIGDSIDIYRSGTFPNPGVLAGSIVGPVLTDGVINEYRYLDENNTVPFSVPISQNETFILAFTFGEAPPAIGPSVVRDTDGIQPNRNAIYADIGTFVWFSNSALGVNGDWVLRAVVDCPVVAQNADVAVTITALPALYTAGSGNLNYTITLSNSGPAASPNTSVVDIFPAGYTATNWTCTPTGGAVCTSGASGSGNIVGAVNLPNASGVTYAVTGSVTAGTNGILSNSATAVVGSPSSDPATGNNTATVNTPPLSDRIFANGFD